MKRSIQLRALLPALCLGLAAAAYAAHGPMASTQRDPEINRALKALVEGRGIPAPDGAVATEPETWTNLQAAEFTARASERLLAQAPADLPSLDETASTPAKTAAPNASNRDMQTLVKEFRKELTAMEVDVREVEKRLKAQETADETMRTELESMRPRTGTQVSGKARGYLQNLRGYGPNRSKLPVNGLATSYIETDFKSLPVPFLLFEAGLRGWASYGPNYDKELIRPAIEVRRVTLTGMSKHLTVTVGDFFKSWSPLTLWNQETVFNRVDPLPMKWRRADAEEIADMDRHPDWRLRGLMLSSAVTLGHGPLPMKARCEVLGGRIKAAQTDNDYASYWTGGRASLSVLKDHLEVTGTGMLFMDDPESADVVYDPLNPLTFERRQGVASASAHLVNLKPMSGVTVSGGTEYAVSRFEDDRANGDRDLRDWALSSTVRVETSKVRAEGKIADNGPDFYSPGAQTLCFTPGSAPFHMSTDRSEDFNLIGMRNRFLFQDFQRPSFTPYLREVEMIWPYGDATPNRQGFTAALSASLGKSGWIKPLLSFTQANEVSADYVIDPITAQAVAVDSMTLVAEARTFTGMEGVLDLDLAQTAKSLGLKRLQAGYKTQTSEGNGTDLKSDTLTGVLDFSLPGKRFTGVVWTFGAAANMADGSDYFLLDGTARFHSLLDGDALGSYTFRTIHTKRMTYLAGLQYTLNSQVFIRLDYSLTAVTDEDDPDYDNREQFWRLGYEAKF